MVVPIREPRNITLLNTTKHSKTHNIARIQDNNIVVNSIKNLFEDNEIRGHLLALSVYKPRSPSISLSKSKEEYHIRIQRDNGKMDEDDLVLQYSNKQVVNKTQKRKKELVSKAADNMNNILHQYVSNKVLTSSQPSGNNMFDIQLNYNINQALDPGS